MRLCAGPTESPQHRAAQNNQYELLRAERKEGWEEGEVGTNSYSFSSPLLLSSFLEQKTDSMMRYLDMVPLKKYGLLNVFVLK